MSDERRYPATVAGPVKHELVVKKSRFLTLVHPVTSPEDAAAVLRAVRKEHWDANHNCSAQVIGLLGDRARSSDDGEPSGSAGAPMLEVIRRRDLTDVLAVVTRYFGGVKLGGGGLVRAYSTAVSEALDRTVIVRRELLQQVTLIVAHDQAGRYANIVRDWVKRRGGKNWPDFVWS